MIGRKRKTLACTLAAVVLAALGLTTRSMDAQVLNIDVDGTGGNGNTQTGYDHFPGGGTNSSANLSQTYSDAFGPGLDATVRLDANRWKTRPVITSGDTAAVALTDLLYDFGGPQDGQTATLGLSLPEGFYDITLYHHESTRASAADAVMTLTDAAGARSPVDLFSSFGNDPATAPSLFTATIESDGTNEITFSYDNQDLGGNTFAFPINGLDLAPAATAVPEPSSIALWSLVGIVLASLGRAHAAQEIAF